MNHLIENKIKRDQLVIVGVPCNGMVDKRKVANLVDGEILAVTEDADTISVKTATGEKKFRKSEVMQQNCTVCTHRNPVIYDELAGELVEEQTDVDRYADVRAIEAMGAD